MKMKKTILAIAILIVGFGVSVQLSAESPRFWVDIETGAAFTGYNDVRIPSDTGTKFSLADDLTPDTIWYYRLQAGVDYRRHSLFGLYAPLKVESTGKADGAIVFRDTSFPDGTDLTGTYVFNSYRLTYAYTFFENSRFKTSAGLTGKVRDAYIALDDGSTEEKRENLGFVPLIHLMARWNFAPGFALLLEGDGLAAPQGRAEDFLLALVYSPDPDLELRLGYRLLEGGSDGGGSVYTFSMFHYVGAGLRWSW